MSWVIPLVTYVGGVLFFAVVIMRRYQRKDVRLIGKSRFPPHLVTWSAACAWPVGLLCLLILGLGLGLLTWLRLAERPAVLPEEPDPSGDLFD